MVVDDPLPYCRLGIEWLTVLVEDHLGYSPANLSRVPGMASLFGASISVQDLVGEARQAQTEIDAATQQIQTHLLVAVSVVRAVAIRIDTAHRAFRANHASGVLLFRANRLLDRDDRTTLEWDRLRRRVCLGARYRLSSSGPCAGKI